MTSVRKLSARVLEHGNVRTMWCQCPALGHDELQPAAYHVKLATKCSGHQSRCPTLDSNAAWGRLAVSIEGELLQKVLGTSSVFVSLSTPATQNTPTEGASLIVCLFETRTPFEFKSRRDTRSKLLGLIRLATRRGRLRALDI